MKTQLSVFVFCCLVAFSCKKDPEPNPHIYMGAGVSDIDGNNYKTVVINNQEWMAENLRTTKFCDGSSINEATSIEDLTENTDPRWTYYNFDANHNIPHGKLYNGFVVDAANPCPCGWHVPTVEDWETLIDFLGGSAEAGKKLRFWSQEFNWGISESPSHNLSKFGAYPSGIFHVNASVNIFAFLGMFNQTMFFTSSLKDDNQYFYYSLGSGASSTINKHFISKPNALSIRCIKN